MKYDVWAIVLAPGDVDWSNFCFDTGIMITGWSKIDGHQHVLAKTASDIGAAYDSVYGHEAWATSDNRKYAIHALDQIANQIKVGDKILVRKGNKQFLAAGEVVGDYQYKPNWVSNDIAHVRDVRYSAIARDHDLFEIMHKHLGKAFAIGFTIYNFGEVERSAWDRFVEECRNSIMS